MRSTQEDRQLVSSVVYCKHINWYMYFSRISCTGQPRLSVNDLHICVERPDIKQIQFFGSFFRNKMNQFPDLHHTV
jgi:hypothetical protein